MSRRSYAPDPPVAKKLARLTYEEIEAGRSPKGGWTRETLHGWGIPWPPTEGWQERLTGEPKPVESGPLEMTLFADASYDEASRLSGWAGWYKSHHMERGVFISGVHEDMPTNAHAEAMALAATLEHAMAAGELRSCVQIMLQSDNQATLSGILFYAHDARVSRASANSVPINRPRRASPFMRTAVGIQKIAAMAREHRWRIVVRHVKAHVGTETGRTSVHSQCDRMARQMMKTRRRELAAA